MENDFLAGEADPFALFDRWFAEAAASEPSDPNAMSLATCDADGMPDVRTVLLKEASPRGFVFYTNTESAKGEELAANPLAAAVFHWKSLHRQVRFRGPAEQVSDAEADAYFATRSRESRLGAWASMQSRPVADRRALVRRFDSAVERFEGREVPRPEYWSGYRLRPLSIEFWAGRSHRLHDRLRFMRKDFDSVWSVERLYP
ncbi:pyridoxamine 5'-phosphate oxidase [Salininema proteolyticum]|uniref:Pyridoxine/pyridoxamine 5'-phosphate oxidase n=1 Tax=Salininema proteolyticum TaxID=1607685 RepID=A0ABV8U325_9ACTN